MSFKDQINRYVDAGARAFWISTHEETRAVPELTALMKDRKVTLYLWSQVSGPYNLMTKKSLADEAPDLEDNGLFPFIRWLRQVKLGQKGEPYALILPNCHSYLKDGIIRLVQEEIFSGKALFFCVSPNPTPPMELQRLITPVRYGLPTAETLASTIAKDYPSNFRTRMADAAVGLTVSEARIATQMALLNYKDEADAVQQIWDSKATFFAERGLAKICIPTESLDSVGGCHHFKRWLRDRKHAFSPDGRSLGIMPRGVLFVGPFGVGKSLLSRAIANELGWRYLEWDTGKLMDMYVGNTEHATDDLLELSTLHAPCVVRIEEVAHQLSGHESSGVTDSGVMARMIGKILTFMEEKAHGLLFVMSTNEPWKLPPAFIRPGRLDGVWRLSLPKEDEIDEILQIQLSKFAPQLIDTKSDFESLCEYMRENKFSGSEVRQVIIEALQTTFPNPISGRDLERTARDIVPAYKVQHELVERIEKWADNRARRA